MTNQPALQNMRDTSAPYTPLVERFYVPQMHCSSCAWKLEGIAKKIPEVRGFDVQLNNRTIELTSGSHESLNLFEKKAKQAGFTLQDVQSNDDFTVGENKENKRRLKHLAVAGFCAGNIMLFSSAHYTGAEDKIGYIFNLLSFVLTLPVLVYSSQDFYRGFWTSLKNRQASVDAPIVVALTLGTLLSAVNLFYFKSQEIYFDSIAALVFLLLAGRYLLFKLQNKVFQKNKLALIPENQKLKKWLNQEWTTCLPKDLKVQDRVFLEEGQIIPADGVLESERVYINQSILTGESEPFLVSKGQRVYGGTQVVSSEAVLSVVKDQNESRISKLLSESIRLKLRQSKFVSLIDHFAQNFTIAILLISVIVLGYWFLAGETWIGIERSLALLIVACPCAMAFGAPLIVSLAIKKAEGLNIVAKSGDVFEKVNNLKNVVCDKTGTLTKGQLFVTDQSNVLDKKDQKIIAQMEAGSSHPIAQAILKHIGPVECDDLELKTKHIDGFGIEGIFENKNYRLSKPNDNDLIANGKTQVGYYVDNQLQCIFSFADQLRHDSSNFVRAMKDFRLNVLLLSGDNHDAVEFTRNQLNIDRDHSFSQTNPEQKLSIISNLKGPSMMIGDGVNDAAALAKASVGVAMAGPIEKILNTSDVILIKNELTKLIDFFKLSHQVRKTLIRLGMFSITYNIICGSLAILGYMSPLFAAVLMPISSVIVSLIVLFNLREKQWK